MKKIFLLISILFLLAAIPIIIYYVGQQQELRKRAAPATTLTISPATNTKTVGDEFSMNVVIDTGENQVVASELHISYDATKLEAQVITNGSLFPNILTSGAIDAGTASITVGASSAKQPIKGTGTVAVVKFKALAKTDSPTAVKLSPSSFVGGLGEGAKSVLVGSTPANVTIREDPTKPTPTTIPSPFASPSLPASDSGSPVRPPPLTPTPTATAAAMISSPGTNLTILTPGNEGTTREDRPEIQGKAKPGATITITIYSTPRTATVTANSSGNWTYTPDTSLEEGPHNIVASVTDENGQIQTATSAFVVAASTERVIPVSGAVENTIILIGIGVSFILFGTLFHPRHL